VAGTAATLAQNVDRCQRLKFLNYMPEG